MEEDKERQQRRERELTSVLEQERQAATQAKLDADSAAQRHHRELQSLQKRLQVRQSSYHELKYLDSTKPNPLAGLKFAPELPPLPGRQPAVPLSTGQDRLHREVLTLRQQLGAAENQLTIANRERGRLQQQVSTQWQSMNGWANS